MVATESTWESGSATDAKESADKNKNLVCEDHRRSQRPINQSIERVIERMDPTGMRSLSSSSGNIRVTSVADAGAGGGITYLDYSRVHIVRPGQSRARSSLSGGGTMVPVEEVPSDDRMAIVGGQYVRVKEVAQQAAEVCRNARQICVQNGNAGAERAARDALSLIDQIASTNFRN